MGPDERLEGVDEAGSDEGAEMLAVLTYGDAVRVGLEVVVIKAVYNGAVPPQEVYRYTVPTMRRILSD